MFAKGTIVEIYEDPLTMQRKEGNAEIVEYVLELGPDLHQYKVNFVNDDPEMLVIRTIKGDSQTIKFVLASLMSTFDGKTAEVIAVLWSEKGYHTTTWGRQTREWVIEQNAGMGIDEATALAFSICSMFGRWGNYEDILSTMKTKVNHV